MAHVPAIFLLNGYHSIDLGFNQPSPAVFNMFHICSDCVFSLAY